MDERVPQPSQAAAPRWLPLPALDRRVLGVLVEKAKTTPDGYPMSINSLRSGVNQKSNRYPLMEQELEDIEEALTRLRAVGAVTEVQGGGRVARYRHHAYEWLGVDKVELAVMTELLLRGAQTEGELRGRAARMEPIADLAALRPVLESLAAKKLIISLTPAGRGHALTHALYEPRELEKVRAEYGANLAAGYDTEPARTASAQAPAPQRAIDTAPVAHASVHAAPSHAAPVGRPSDEAAHHEATRNELSQLRSEVEDLRSELSRLRSDVDELLTQLR